MNFKHRHQMGIVDLNPAYFIGEKNPLPNRANTF